MVARARRARAARTHIACRLRPNSYGGSWQEGGARAASPPLQGLVPPARRPRRAGAPWEARARAARVQTAGEDLVVVRGGGGGGGGSNSELPQAQASPDRGKYSLHFLTLPYTTNGAISPPPRPGRAPRAHGTSPHALADSKGARPLMRPLKNSHYPRVFVIVEPSSYMDAFINRGGEEGGRNRKRAVLPRVVQH